MRTEGPLEGVLGGLLGESRAQGRRKEGGREGRSEGSIASRSRWWSGTAGDEGHVDVRLNLGCESRQ